MSHWPHRRMGSRGQWAPTHPRAGLGAAIGLRKSSWQRRDAGSAAALRSMGGGVALSGRQLVPMAVRRPWPPGPRPGRPRIALMAVVLAAAMPLRISDAFPIIHSVSVLDLLLIVAAATLYLDLALRPIDPGYRQLFWILCVPLLLSIVSIVWSQDRPATVRSLIIYVEGLIAYLFVVRELTALPAARVMRYIERYAYLLILPGVLLLLHVPGFEPQEQGLSHTSGTYLSYYTRLSHPVLGRSNNLATLLAFLAPLLLYWGHVRRDRRITVAAFVSLLAIFTTLSRGVLLAFLLAGLLYAPLAAGRRRAVRRGLAPKITAIVALGFVAIAAFYTVNPDTREFFAGRLSLANVQDRSELISRSLTKVASRPLLGYGAGVVPDHDPLLSTSVHNTFLQQVVYVGLPLGMLASLALCAIPAFFLARGPTPFAGVIAYTLMVQLVLFLFESSFEGTVLRVLFYMSVGLAAALLRAVESEAPASAGADP
jgi:O-antigen ligase